MRDLVVVTRVAVRQKGTPPPEWVEERFGLMARTAGACLARVDVPLRWVWLTCRAREDQVAEHAERLGDARVVVCNGGAKSHPEIGDSVTVRLDSDDAWFPWVFGYLAESSWPADTLVDFPNGYQQTAGLVAEKDYRFQGPFLAVTQPAERSLDTCGPHTTARKGRRVVSVERRAWVQTVHGGNLHNRWEGGRLVSRGVLAPAGL